MVTRRQHFVFRHYLGFWAENKTVRVLRDGNVFDANPVNVSVEKDFYSLNRLTSDDLEFFHRVMCSPFFTEHAVKSNQIWAERYVFWAEASHLITESDRTTHAEKKAADSVRIELLEKLHAGMEARAVGLLGEIREGDISFLSSETKAIDFFTYISHQMCRTKKMRDRLVATSTGCQSPESMRRLKDLIAFCMAETVAASLYAERDKYSSKILRTTGSAEFITSDQPVINLFDTGNGTPPDHLVLYYPIGVNRAFLYYPNELPFDEIGEKLSGNEVSQLNQAMLCKSHEFLISSKHFELKEFSRSITPVTFEAPKFIQERMSSR